MNTTFIIADFKAVASGVRRDKTSDHRPTEYADQPSNISAPDRDLMLGAVIERLRAVVGRQTWQGDLINVDLPRIILECADGLDTLRFAVKPS